MQVLFFCPFVCLLSTLSWHLLASGGARSTCGRLLLLALLLLLCCALALPLLVGLDRLAVLLALLASPLVRRRSLEGR